MAYKTILYFQTMALQMRGFSSWADLEAVAKRRKWSAATLLRKQHEIDAIATVLHGAYISGATDALNEIRETGRLNNV